MNGYKLAVIGVGNMAKAVISGIQNSDVSVSKILMFDKNAEQYETLTSGRCPYVYCSSVAAAVASADCVLLSVKPQNFPEVLEEISAVENAAEKLYITIAAGITVQSVSDMLGGANVIRALPNLPMTIGQGVSVICKNPSVPSSDFDFVCSLFNTSGSTLVIDESEMNRLIGVTSSSPAYVFKLIDAMLKGAQAQGLECDGMLDAICDVFIGSAMLLKQSGEAPSTLISRVASKGGTTEQALLKLDEGGICDTIGNAMSACTRRAEELGR